MLNVFEDQSFLDLVHVYAAEIAICGFSFNDVLSEIFAIKLASCPKFGPNFDVFGPSNVSAGGPQISDLIFTPRALRS